MRCFSFAQHDRERTKGHDGACPSSAEIVRDVSAALDMTNQGGEGRELKVEGVTKVEG